MVKTNGTLACLGEFVYSTTPLQLPLFSEPSFFQLYYVFTFFFFTLNRRFKNLFISLPELQGWNPDFCKLKGKQRSAGKIGELEKLKVHFWTKGRKLVSVRVMGSFEISTVRESGIPVSKFLAPVRTGSRGFSRLKFFICILKNTNNCYEQ